MTPEDVIERLAANPGTAGLFCDFDGTLTPIVDDPATSVLDDETHELLASLARRLALVAVISGRPARFLLERARVPGAVLLGLYGLETATDGRVAARPEAAAWQPAVERATAQLRSALGSDRGVRIEEKGRSVAAHWRGAPDRDRAARRVGAAVRAVAERTGLAVAPGKLVTELRPPVSWDKGSAVSALCDEHGLSLAVYIGDDEGDVPAFAAVRARGGIALAVDHGEETPPAAIGAADAVLAGVDDVRRWLGALDPAIRADRGSSTSS